jgi:crotonobetainyl-CoA:carnitine CoA-transferase CaiB-like acyl-CoA transferase
VHSDAEWRALVGAMGSPEWATDERFDTVEGRLTHQDDLDARIGEWTRGFERHALMETLQAAGVEAGAVQDMADLQVDPQLAHRGHFENLHHEFLGDCRFERSGFRLSGGEAGYDRPAPLLGEHNQEILGDLLGLSDGRIQELIEKEVVV